MGLLTVILLSAGDYLLEESVYPPGDPVQEALALPHNGPETVTAEVNDPAIRKLLAKAAGVGSLEKTERVQLSVTADGWSRSAQTSPMDFSHYTLKYPTLEARELFSARFRAAIEKYITIRLTGHTRDFAVASFSQRLPAAASLPGSRNVVLNTYREIPAAWLKLWEENGKPVGYYLVDGDLAWTFRVMGQHPWRQVVDGQEFDPKLKQVFAAARKKAEANLTARGVVRRLGYCHVYWAELQNVLREDYQIRWWCPTDLNGGVYD